MEPGSCDASLFLRPLARRRSDNTLRVCCTSEPRFASFIGLLSLLRRVVSSRPECRWPVAPETFHAPPSIYPIRARTVSCPRPPSGAVRRQPATRLLCRTPKYGGSPLLTPACTEQTPPRGPAALLIPGHARWLAKLYELLSLIRTPYVLAQPGRLCTHAIVHLSIPPALPHAVYCRHGEKLAAPQSLRVRNQIGPVHLVQVGRQGCAD